MTNKNGSDDNERGSSGGWFSLTTSVEHVDDEEFMEKLDPEARDWFQTHEVSLDETDEQDSVDDEDTSDGGSGLVSSLASRVRGSSSPTEPDHSSPQSGPAPEPSSHSRGTFVFPADAQFMQSLEIRAKNGAQRRVETVYAVTGASYTDPTDLFALDNPEYYDSATRRSVTSFGGKMARAVANRFPSDERPKLIARFHTHPGGSTTPSDADRSSAADIRDNFQQAFDTEDFEFFHGIHAYSELSNPGGVDRDPEAMSNTVSWDGEQYRHTLALYGPRFRNAKEVAIRDEL